MKIYAYPHFYVGDIFFDFPIFSKFDKYSKFEKYKLRYESYYYKRVMFVYLSIQTISGRLDLNRKTKVVGEDERRRLT
jgi:hypothetical protein